MKTIGEAVRQWRTKRKISLCGLARKSGVSKGAVSSIENNHNVNPGVDVLLRLAGGLDITLSKLCDGVNSVAPW